MGWHLSSYVSQGRWANTFGNIVHEGMLVGSFPICAVWMQHSLCQMGCNSSHQTEEMVCRRINTLICMHMKTRGPSWCSTELNPNCLQLVWVQPSYSSCVCTVENMDIERNYMLFSEYLKRLQHHTQFTEAEFVQWATQGNVEGLRFQ